MGRYFETMQISHHFSDYTLTHQLLRPVMNPAWEYNCDGCQMMFFIPYNSLYLSCFFLRNNFLFSPYIFVFLYLLQRGFMYFYLIQWIIIFHCRNLFWCSDCPRFESPSELASVFCQVTITDRGLPYSFSTRRQSRLKLVLHPHRPSPGTSHFSKEPWFLLVENGI